MKLTKIQFAGSFTRAMGSMFTKHLLQFMVFTPAINASGVKSTGQYSASSLRITRKNAKVASRSHGRSMTFIFYTICVEI